MAKTDADRSRERAHSSGVTAERLAREIERVDAKNRKIEGLRAEIEGLRAELQSAKQEILDLTGDLHAEKSAHERRLRADTKRIWEFHRAAIACSR